MFTELKEKISQLRHELLQKMEEERNSWVLGGGRIPREKFEELKNLYKDPMVRNGLAAADVYASDSVSFGIQDLRNYLSELEKAGDTNVKVHFGIVVKNQTRFLTVMFAPEKAVLNDNNCYDQGEVHSTE